MIHDRWSCISEFSVNRCVNFVGNMSETSSRAAKNAVKKNSYVGSISSLIVFSVLLMCWIAGFASRLFAVIRFESIIHEFDPW